VVSIDVATSNPDYIYAVVTPAATNGTTQIWKSTNGGSSWSSITPSNISSYNLQCVEWSKSLYL